MTSWPRWLGPPSTVVASGPGVVPGLGLGRADERVGQVHARRCDLNLDLDLGRNLDLNLGRDLDLGLGQHGLARVNRRIGRGVERGVDGVEARRIGLNGVVTAGDERERNE